MALLIPSFVDERTPPGERDVFALLSKCPDDWVTLHSLDLAPWNRGLRTEIDFLVIVPDLGIVCVEVKSHNELWFDGQRWHPETITRSPFKQALDARYSFARRMFGVMPSLKHVPITHLCVFPRAHFSMSPNLSIERCEYIDERDLRSLPDESAFAGLVRERVSASIASDPALHPLTRKLTAAQVKELVQRCSPVQRRHPSAAEEVARRAAEMERILRVQQAPVLSLARLNPRLIVTGPAGTGKTLIAMELARRAASEGQRVALLCYNQLIGDWISSKLAATQPCLPSLVAGRAIRVMAQMADIAIPANPLNSFWDVDLPNLLEERLTDPEFGESARFDYLIIDEAQDLIARPSLWACLEQFLSGGFATGRFAIFGDFENQVLMNADVVRSTLSELARTLAPVRWELTENCRNYSSVGEAATRLAGCSPNLYSSYLRSGGGAKSYDVEFYESDDQQLVILQRWLKDFKEHGLKPSDVTILSFIRDEFSAAARLRSAGVILEPARARSDRYTTYASVQAFKGMENKAVILTDVVLDSHDFKRALFYTGATRGTEYVRVLCHASSISRLKEWLTPGEVA